MSNDNQDLVKWNVSDMDAEPDQTIDPSMIPSDPPGYVPTAVVDEESSLLDLENVLDEEAEDISDAEILSNARLRLEQGRLYEMLMTSNIFDNLDADQQAIKNVQREMKRFAKERMEVMLGMKSPQIESSNVVGQFNQKEVEVLKSLADKLSGGASSGPQPGPKNTSLTPISKNSNKTKPAPKIMPNRTLKQESKQENKDDLELSTKPIEEMTYDEKLEYNRKKAAIYEARKTQAPLAIPMPDYNGLNAAYSAKGASFNTGNSALNKIAANMLKG